MQSERLVNIAEAAERLSVSVPTLRRWIGHRRVPFVRISRAIRFSPRALEQFIEQHAVLPLNRHEDR